MVKWRVSAGTAAERPLAAVSSGAQQTRARSPFQAQPARAQWTRAGTISFSWMAAMARSSVSAKAIGVPSAA